MTGAAVIGQGPYSTVHSAPEVRPPTFLPKLARARLLCGTRPQAIAQANVDAAVQRMRQLQDEQAD